PVAPPPVAPMVAPASALELDSTPTTLSCAVAGSAAASEIAATEARSSLFIVLFLPSAGRSPPVAGTRRPSGSRPVSAPWPNNGRRRASFRSERMGWRQACSALWRSCRSFSLTMRWWLSVVDCTRYCTAWPSKGSSATTLHSPPLRLELPRLGKRSSTWPTWYLCMEWLLLRTRSSSPFAQSSRLCRPMGNNPHADGPAGAGRFRILWLDGPRDGFRLVSIFSETEAASECRDFIGRRDRRPQRSP